MKKLILLPQPRQLNRTGDDVTLAGAAAEPRVRIDPAAVAQPQGYRLTIAPAGIDIVAHDEAGAFYAKQTLDQIASQSPAGVLPGLRISDWPDFAQRGVMLDISRDKVPTMATLLELVDLLASWKINHFELYTEHTFAYRNHETVWRNASPMTAEEIRQLDAYCRQRHIELVPNQNSFGHMHRWLEHDAYKPMAEAPDGWDTPWGQHRTEPFTLCPSDPRSLALLTEMFDELLPNFTSKLFNVGCDETWDLGQGRSKEECEARGKGRVYLDFLKQIHGLVTQRNRTMMFWGDIILKDPELIAELPKDLIALEWGYGADHNFAERCAKFAASGLKFYVCPGTSSWNTIAGLTDNAMTNLRNAAEAGLAHGAIGYLNTDWGDNGHWQPLVVSYVPYAYGAAVSWACEANRDADVTGAVNWFAFEDHADVMAAVAFDMGNVTSVLPAMGNQHILFCLLQNPDKPMTGSPLDKLEAKRLDEAEDLLWDLLDQVDETDMQGNDAGLVMDEFIQAAKLLIHACQLGKARLAHPTATVAEMPLTVRADLAADFEPLVAEHRRLWLARNREGGLAESVARMTKLLKAYRA